MLLAELVELGREAWRINQRERAIRVQINALREIEEISNKKKISNKSYEHRPLTASAPDHINDHQPTLRHRPKTRSGCLR
jgi:hypothetical protein